MSGVAYGVENITEGIRKDNGEVHLGFRSEQ